MLLAVNQQLEVDLVIGFSCAVGDLEYLRQDASLAKHAGLIDISLVDHSSSIDEFGYHQVQI